MEKEHPLKIGLEIHGYLDTKEKLFCKCSTNSDEEPNSNICPICTGTPGSKPMMPNEEAMKKLLQIVEKCLRRLRSKERKLKKKPLRHGRHQHGGWSESFPINGGGERLLPGIKNDQCLLDMRCLIMAGTHRNNIPSYILLKTRFYFENPEKDLIASITIMN